MIFHSWFFRLQRCYLRQGVRSSVPQGSCESLSLTLAAQVPVGSFPPHGEDRDYSKMSVLEYKFPGERRTSFTLGFSSLNLTTGYRHPVGVGGERTCVVAGSGLLGFSAAVSPRVFQSLASDHSPYAETLPYVILCQHPLESRAAMSFS